MKQLLWGIATLFVNLSPTSAQEAPAPNYRKTLNHAIHRNNPARRMAQVFPGKIDRQKQKDFP
ncbi:MAG: hypothetical protein PHX49_02335 [Bacteroidales bacterium]|jgi:hypothetical protein|nr:hypothetical protein [Bacteroidales bacterium]